MGYKKYTGERNSQKTYFDSEVMKMGSMAYYTFRIRTRKPYDCTIRQ